MVELPNKSFFRVDEVALLFQVSSRTVRRLIEDEKIPVLKLRGTIRISKADLAGFINKKMDNSGQ